MKRLFWLMVLLPVIALSKSSLVVIDFEPHGVSRDQAVMVTDLLRTELLKAQETFVVERERINAAIGERGYSEIGIAEGVELGRSLGADKVVLGRMGILDGSYVITVRMIDVKTMRIDFADRYSCKATVDSINELVKEIADRILEVLPSTRGEIVLRRGDTVYITLSLKDGMKEGMELQVFRVERILDDEGNVVFEGEEEIGRIRVEKVGSKGSVARVIEEKKRIEKGDVVKASTEECRVVCGKPLQGIEPEGSEKTRSYPYWIEHDELGRATDRLWIRVDELPAGKAKVLYVNLNGVSSPDGDRVFEFFDDFDGNELDSKWMVDVPAGVVTVSDGKVTFDSNGQDTDWYYGSVKYAPVVYTPVSGDFVVETRLSSCHLETTNWAAIVWIGGSDFRNNAYKILYGQNDSLGSLRQIWMDKLVSDRASVGFVQTGEYPPLPHVYRIYHVGTTLNFTYDDGSEHVITSLEEEFVPEYVGIGLQDWWGGNDSRCSFEWFFLRKYSPNEMEIKVTPLGKGIYKINITNLGTNDLTDYQVAIPLSSIPGITSKDQRLRVADTP